MRNPSALLLALLPIGALACSTPIDSASSDAMLNQAAAEPVPQAGLVTCVDAANPENKAVVTVTNDLDISWNMFGSVGTSPLVGAGFTFDAGDDATKLVIALENGRRMVVRGNYEEERLFTVDAPEGRLDCGPTSRMKAFNIRNILEVTTKSFEKSAELARCNFGGTQTAVMVRPALRGAGAIVEGSAPNTGRFTLVATSDQVGKGATHLIGKGATGGVGAATGAQPFTALTFIGNAISNDGSTERQFPENTCTVRGLDYARGLIAGEEL